jgi:hypothetical protein
LHPSHRFDALTTILRTEDFMRRYMWPNSCLPSATALVTAAHGASRGRFTLERVENHAAHYPRTLREWGRRLDARLTHAALGLIGAKEGEPTKVPLAGVSDTQRDQTLLQTLPVPAGAEADAFEALKRKWQYLFAYAAAGFQKGYITCAFDLFTVPTCELISVYRPYVDVRSTFRRGSGMNAPCDHRVPKETELSPLSLLIGTSYPRFSFVPLALSTFSASAWLYTRLLMSPHFVTISDDLND